MIIIKNKTIKFLLCTFVILCGLCGCSFGLDGTSESTEEVLALHTDSDVMLDEIYDNSYSDAPDAFSEMCDENDEYVFDLDSAPEYNDEPYIELNDNYPDFASEEMTTDTFELYAELDELGRCGETFANISMEIMPTEERGEIGQIKPSGWHTVKYNGLVEGNYLYNRCHLIGYQLAGENDNEKNLITGTRYLNTVGMLPFENDVAEYVKTTGNHVLYRVTPIFEGSNLVASGVVMEAYSVEDNGQGICFNVFVYNVQPGVIIDYATGDSWLDENYMAEDDFEDTQNDVAESVIEEVQACEYDYVLNKNTRKFHHPDCDSVLDIKEKNKEYFIGSREEAIAAGYEPCGRCEP